MVYEADTGKNEPNQPGSAFFFDCFYLPRGFDGCGGSRRKTEPGNE